MLTETKSEQQEIASTREITYAEALREGMRQAMQSDPTVFLIGEDIGVYGGAFGVTAGLEDEFGPERVRDTPISEATIAGACIGAALTGMHPVGEIQFMDFVTLSMEQLALQAAKLRFMFGGKASVPMVLRMPAGSGTGAAAQHSGSLENLLVHIPGLKVVMPSNAYDAKGLLLSSIYDGNPVIFVEHKLLYKTREIVPEEMYRLPLSQSKVVPSIVSEVGSHPAARHRSRTYRLPNPIATSPRSIASLRNLTEFFTLLPEASVHRVTATQKSRASSRRTTQR